MFRVWGRSVRDAPPMKANGAVAFNAADFAGFRVKRLRNRHAFPIPHFLTVPNK